MKSSIENRSRLARERQRRSELAAPMCAVVYIFEREGARGGAFWWLILSCGHAVARKRFVVRTPAAMFRPLEEKLAPKHAQCHYCGSGSAKQAPWLTIKAFGGAVP